MTQTVAQWLSLGLIAMVMALAFLVMGRYVRMWKRGSRALLPLHVWTMVLSYYLLILTLASRPIDWRAVGFIPALLLGLFSLATMWRLQNELEAKNLARRQQLAEQYHHEHCEQFCETDSDDRQV